MNENPHASPRPPRWATWLLERLAAPHLREEVLGDLEERFGRHWQRHSPGKARLRFVLDLLTLLHPRLWRRKPDPYAYPSTPPFYPAMLSHHLLLTYRTFLRFKGSFFINLVGLSTGLACTLLIYLWVHDELRVDKFHANDSRLFQVAKRHEDNGGKRISVYDWTPGLLAEALAAEMPEVESAVSVVPYRGKPGILTIGNKHIRGREQYADRHYFDMFSYRLLQGDPQRLLRDKYSVVLSDELARKLFGRTDVVGKTVKWTKEKFTGTYLVAGVFEKLHHTTDPFDLVFPFALYRTIKPEIDDWKWGDPSTYVLLREGAGPAALNQKLGTYLQEKTGEKYQSLFIRRYSDRYLYNNYENGVQAGGRIEYVRLFSIIAAFILTIACINFMNLSTAKASRRLKEIGIKKAIGAARSTLLLQFLTESVLMAFFALGVALVGAALLLPGFNQITGKELSLHATPGLVLATLAITLLTGLLAGSYPALYLSGFHPMAVLKGKLHASGGEAWARKGLVVFQFTLSVILIVSVVVVYEQVAYIQSKNLGYNRDNIITFKKEGRL
ncbi:MAG TPA: ABC transporter permease, partial [Cytophagales bacterium]